MHLYQLNIKSYLKRGKYILMAIVFIVNNDIMAEDIVFPSLERDDYITLLLKKSLSYTSEKNYRLRYFGKNIPKSRDFTLLANKKGIDVMAAGSTMQRESLYLPIRFPILRGLNGWRIPLVTTENKDLFLNIDSLRDFKRIVPGQFHAWSDTQIFESNNINVEKGSSYNGLFQMLVAGRFDYFPRSILEIGWELKANKHLDIIKEPHSLIHYHTAYYFYVHNENLSLAADIKFGLEQALADGSLEKLFMEHYGGFVRSKEKYINSTILFYLKKPLDLEKSYGLI